MTDIEILMQVADMLLLTAMYIAFPALILGAAIKYLSRL